MTRLRLAGLFLLAIVTTGCVGQYGDFHIVPTRTNGYQFDVLHCPTQSANGWTISSPCTYVMSF